MSRLSIIFLALCTSCISEMNDTIIKVSISEFYSNVPISDYQIQIFEKDNWERTVKYFSSDKNGLIEYVIHNDEKTHYCISSSFNEVKTNNLLYSFGSIASVPSRQTNNIQLKLKQLYFLRLQIIDSSKVYSYAKIFNYEPINQHVFYTDRVKDTLLNVLMLVPEELNKIVVYISNDSTFKSYKSLDMNFYAPKVDTFYYRLAL